MELKTFDVIRTKWFRVYLAWGGLGLVNVSFAPKTFHYEDHRVDPPVQKSCVDFGWSAHLLQLTDWGQYGDSRAWCWEERGYDGWDTRWSAGPLGCVYRVNC